MSNSGTVAILAPVSCLVSYTYKGWPGTLAAAGGIAFGGLVAATGHFFLQDFDTGSDRGIYWAITGVIFLAFELSALGIIGGKGSNLTNWVYENHTRAIGTGLALTVVWYALWELIF